MAPIKFEDNLKETLEKRTIQPSKDAWNTLENKLDTTSGNTSKTRFWIWGIAASIVGILLISTLIFKKEIEPVEKTIVKETEQEVNFQENEVTPSNGNEAVTKIQKEQPFQESATPIASKDKSQPQPKRTPEIKEPIKTEMALEELDKETLQPYEDRKVNEVVAQVRELVEKNKAVTEQEIDSLLRVAQQDINQQKSYDPNTGKVDAMALLQDVENDLDKSFRDKVFDALSSGIEGLASAIVQRNE